MTTNVRTPDVSIIIPFTRQTKAISVIKSILAQNFTNIELIIVGKGSGIIKKSLSLKNINVSNIDTCFISMPGRARNLGAKAAKGEYLIFLDDDCIPQRKWLEENIRSLNNPLIGAVGGMVKNSSNKYFAKCVDYSNFTHTQGNKLLEMPICAASFGIRRRVFREVGGFNRTMRVGEDTDICMRLAALGYKTIYNPNIKVIHNHDRDTFMSLLKYQYNNGRLKGLTIERNYPVNAWFSFLSKISNPLIYWFFILPFAFLATLNSIYVNIKDNKYVFYYLPGIFVGKMACQLGIYFWILRNPRTFAFKRV